MSRAEWNGDDRSFANHDWNRDGVLSGDELLAGATRPTAARLPARPRRRATESDEVLFARRDVNRDNVCRAASGRAPPASSTGWTSTRTAC